MSNFKGGSKGIEEADSVSESSVLRIFKNTKIFPVMMKQNTPVKGFVMPDFDRSLSKNDSAFATSTSPYRLPDVLDKSTNHPAFSSWFIQVKAYTFYEGKYHFLSPRQFNEPDPIDDLRLHIIRNSMAQYEYLTKKPIDWKNTPFVLPRFETVTFVNAVCNPTYTGKDGTDIESKPRVLAIKYTGFEEVVRALNDGGPRSIDPIDSNWPVYMLGDVTNPDRAVEFHSAIHQLSSANKQGKFITLEFGTIRQNGTEASLDVVTRPFTDEELSARLDFEDEDNVWYKPSYQEIVDLLIELGHVPYDLLAKVCGDKAEIHQKKEIPAYQSASTKKDTVEAPTPAAPAAPEPPAAPSAPEPPAPPVSKSLPELEYWIAEGSNVSKVKESELRAKVNNGFSGAVMKVGESAWTDAAHYGIVAVPVAPVAPPAAPSAPEPPAPPAPPAAPSMVQAAPSLNPTPSDQVEMRTKEEEEEWTALRARLADSNNGGAKSLGPTELRRLGTLGRKRPYAG